MNDLLLGPDGVILEALEDFFNKNRSNCYAKKTVIRLLA